MGTGIVGPGITGCGIGGRVFVTGGCAQGWSGGAAAKRVGAKGWSGGAVAKPVGAPAMGPGTALNLAGGGLTAPAYGGAADSCCGPVRTGTGAQGGS